MNKQLLNDLTYADLGGKRRLRRYVVAALVIAAALAVIWVVAQLQRQQVAAVIDATPRSLAEVLPSWTPVSAAVSEAALTEPPTPVSKAAPMPVTPTPCPTDPADWTLADIAPDDNFKRIVPGCVYDGLARTAAWALAAYSMGYSGAEAAEALGFDRMPLRAVANGTSVIGMTNTMGPMPITVSYPPPHPDLRTWVLDLGLQPAVTFTLRGCFRTYTITGNERQDWGVEYPVICVLARDDEGAWAVSELNGNWFTAGNGIDHASRRTFTLFGYAGDGNWYWIGIQKDPQVDLQTVEMQNDRQLITARHGITPWDADWAAATFGLATQPLPENWQSFTDQVNIQPILDEINAAFQTFLEGVGEP